MIKIVLAVKQPSYKDFKNLVQYNYKEGLPVNRNLNAIFKEFFKKKMWSK